MTYFFTEDVDLRFGFQKHPFRHVKRKKKLKSESEKNINFVHCNIVVLPRIKKFF